MNVDQLETLDYDAGAACDEMSGAAEKDPF